MMVVLSQMSGDHMDRASLLELLARALAGAQEERGEQGERGEGGE